MVNGIINSSRCLTKPSRNQINLPLVAAAVTSCIDTWHRSFLLAIDQNLVTVELQAPIFKIADRGFKTVVDKEMIQRQKLTFLSLDLADL